MKKFWIKFYEIMQATSFGQQLQNQKLSAYNFPKSHIFLSLKIVYIPASSEDSGEIPFSIFV